MASTKSEAKSQMGKYVMCFQMVGKRTKPFEAKITGEPNGSYWVVKDGREEYKVNRGACSSVPYRKKEIGTAAYREKVLSETSASNGDRKSKGPSRRAPNVRKPRGDSTVSPRKSVSPGRKRSGNRKDPKPAGGVGDKEKKGWGRIVGNSS